MYGKRESSFLYKGFVGVLIFGFLVFLVLFPSYLTQAQYSEKSLRDTHHEFDRAFVEWTNRVNEKAEHVSLSSPDFWNEPREWWFEMEVGEKFRRFEKELSDAE